MCIYICMHLCRIIWQSSRLWGAPTVHPACSADLRWKAYWYYQPPGRARGGFPWFSVAEGYVHGIFNAVQLINGVISLENRLGTEKNNVAITVDWNPCFACFEHMFFSIVLRMRFLNGGFNGIKVIFNGHFGMIYDPQMDGLWDRKFPI